MSVYTPPPISPFSIAALSRFRFDVRLDSPEQLTRDRLADGSFFKGDWRIIVNHFAQNLDSDQFRRVLEHLSPQMMAVNGFGPYTLYYNNTFYDDNTQKTMLKDQDEWSHYCNMRLEIDENFRHEKNGEKEYQNMLTAFWLVAAYARYHPDFAENIGFYKSSILTLLSWLHEGRHCIYHDFERDTSPDLETLVISPCSNINIGGASFDVRKVRTALEELVSR